MKQNSKSENTVNPIGCRIKAIREAKGITQDVMADKIGVTQSNYGRLEKNDDRLKIKHLQIISKELGVSIDFLITGKEAKGLKYIGELFVDGKRLIVREVLN